MRKTFKNQDKEILLDAFGWSCGLCGDIIGVSIHHIDPKVDNSNCILNGIPLCTGLFNCHKNNHRPEFQVRLWNIVYEKLKAYGYEFTEKDLKFYDDHTRINSKTSKD